MLDKIKAADKKKGKKGIYKNVPIGLAIGTCNIKDLYSPKPAACMFAWAVDVDGIQTVGRNFVELRETLIQMLDAAQGAHLVIFVHDLPEFFQFSRLYMDIDRVFADKPRHVLDYVIFGGIHFRSGREISGMTLQENARRLGGEKPFQVRLPSQEYPQQSPDSFLDVDSMICIKEEAATMRALAAEHIQRAGGVGSIPLTKTGYVRRFLRDRLLWGKGPGTTRKDYYSALGYKRALRACTMSAEEYCILKAISCGGLCGYNGGFVGEIVNDPLYFDRKSAYPAHMLLDYVPDGIPKYKQNPPFSSVMAAGKRFCVGGVFTFRNLRAKSSLMLYIRESYAMEPENPHFMNKYLYSADVVTVPCTELDLQCISECYEWESAECAECVVYRRRKLPILIRKYVLARFAEKEQAKDPEQRRVAKELLNCIYGLLVTDPVREVQEYDIDAGKWKEPEEIDLETALQEYNDSETRFVRYPWGIWIAAHCRRSEWRAWGNSGQSFLYGDTDCIITADDEFHTVRSFVARENARIEEQCEICARELGVKLDRLKSGNIFIGQWDLSEHIHRLCYLGQKNYIIEEHDGRVKVVMAGVDPDLAGDYLRIICGRHAVEDFKAVTVYPSLYRRKSDGRVVSATGRKLIHYINEERKGWFEDFSGIKSPYHALTGAIVMYTDVTRKRLADYEAKKQNEERQEPAAGGAPALP